MAYNKEIKWYGRGGHGLVSASNLLCQMAVKKGFYAQSIPFFGAERRGAPTRVFTRISDRPIMKRSEITEPDIVVVTDPALLQLVDPLKGLKKSGMVILNAKDISKSINELKNYKVVSVNAVDISLKADLKVGGIPVVTIPLLGAILKILGIVDFETAVEVIRSMWREEIAKKNIRALERAMGVVEVE